MDPRTLKLADLLVNYSLAVQPKEWVVIIGDIVAMPLINASLQKVLEAGGNPSLRLMSNELDETLLQTGSEEQVSWTPPTLKLVYEQMDAFLYLRATTNTRHQSGINPEKQVSYFRGRKELSKIRKKRVAEGSLRWSLTEFPCPAFAQEADMSLRDYEDFVYRATYVDQPDPAACWETVHDEQERLVQWLRGKETVSLRSPNIDLTMSIAARDFKNSSGKANMPSGEIYTSPVEESVNGWVRFSFPAIRYGREVEGVEFKFEGGKIVDARADKNEAYLLSQLNIDDGSRFLGELGIGTNYQIQQFTKSILYDEKIGGTIHLAIGNGFPELGGKNVSSIHWDFICDMRTDSEILVDGEVFYKDGEFLV